MNLGRGLTVININLQCTTAEELKEKVLALAGILSSDTSSNHLSVATSVEHHLAVVPTPTVVESPETGHLNNSLPEVKTGNDVKIPVPSQLDTKKKSKKAAAIVEETKSETLPPTSLPEVKNESVAAAIPTKDQVHANLQSVFKKYGAGDTQADKDRGYAKCKEILHQFNASRIYDLKEEQYADLISACEVALQ